MWFACAGSEGGTYSRDSVGCQQILTILLSYNQCGPLSSVESFIVLLHQCLLCHKEPARRKKLGAFCLLLAGYLWHKDSWLPWRPKALSRGLWMRGDGSLRHKSSGGTVGTVLDIEVNHTAKGMRISQLETSTGDWYSNLVRIEQSLLQRNFIQGPKIFKVSTPKTRI